MTASTKPVPPHGTTARYYGSRRSGRNGCRCTDCREAARRRRKHASVRGPLKVAAAPARTHVTWLLAAGASLQPIAEQSGCAVNTVRALAAGRDTPIWATTHSRLLAVRHAPETQAPVPALGSIRRVRALVALGHAVSAIQAQAGISHNVMAGLVTGAAEGVWGCTAAAVDDTYRRLSMTPGTSARSRRRAEREGWPPPLAWMNIDDPDEHPSGWQRPSWRRAEDLVEDAEFVRATTGADWDAVAARLGVSRNTLDKARERAAKRARQGVPA